MTSCWIVTEGLAGTENQCLGVAEALGVMPVIKRIGLRQPWQSLSPFIGFECAATFTGDPLFPPWPDLVIAAGRKAIAAARHIKRQSGGATFILFLQKPQVKSRALDLIAAPAHDNLSGENVIVTVAAPNRITEELLTDAKQEFADSLKNLPAPRVAVLIGGNSKTHQMTPQVTDKLARQLKRLADHGYSLMITASRRTGEENRAKLQNELGHSENIYFWDGAGNNPYFGFLAWADYIIVTEDSVSMISEAATTGKPVFIAPLEGKSGKFRRFRENLEQKAIIRPFTGTLEKYEYKPLNDAAMVAESVQKHMKT